MSRSTLSVFVAGVVVGVMIAQLVGPSLPFLGGGQAPLPVEGQVLVVEDSQYLSAVTPLIERANRSVYVIMFVMKYDPGDDDDPVNELLSILADTASRGVDVRVLVDEETRDSYPQTIEFLKEHGIGVRLDKSSGITTHAKVVIVDGEFVVIGSHNWTESALRYNHEVSALIRSGKAAEELTNYFERLWDEGRAV